MAQQQWWSKVKTGSKSGFDKVWQATNKLAEPVNKLSNKLGSEAFFPTTLDKESDKAARILKSFCSKYALPANWTRRSLNLVFLCRGWLLRRRRIPR